MYWLVLHHPNYKPQFTLNLVAVGESTNAHALPSCSANKKDLISAKMKPRALRSKVTSSTLGVRVDNRSLNHYMEIEDPLRASVGGVTLSSSPHNSATSNTHVSMTAGSWIRSPRMIATSCNVIVTPQIIL